MVIRLTMKVELFGILFLEEEKPQHKIKNSLVY
jgi:hypothetical protein